MIDADLFTAFASGLAISVISPVLLNWLAVRERRQERREEYRRQDEVAAKAAAAVIQAQKATRVMIGNQQEIRRVTEAAAIAQSEQLSNIHTLVNSEKTVALQAQLTQTKISLALLRRLEGHSEEPGDREAIEAAEADIKRLELLISERLAPQETKELILP